MENLLVSEEIENQIDKTQFEENESELGPMIFVHFKYKNIEISGVLEKYSNKIGNNVSSEELLFKFLVETKNVSLFQKNMDNIQKAILTLDNKNIGEFSVEGLIVKKILVEQDLDRAGCSITVIYG